jgi:hypothetical protein
LKSGLQKIDLLAVELLIIEEMSVYVESHLDTRMPHLRGHVFDVLFSVNPQACVGLPRAAKGSATVPSSDTVTFFLEYDPCFRFET